MNITTFSSKILPINKKVRVAFDIEEALDTREEFFQCHFNSFAATGGKLG